MKNKHKNKHPLGGRAGYPFVVLAPKSSHQSRFSLFAPSLIACPSLLAKAFVAVGYHFYPYRSHRANLVPYVSNPI